ncbi:MAG: bifunctional riboflavin kinase/FAD synthetase [Pseudomonadota bacterium]
MRVLRHYDSVPDAARGGVAVLGNFDGVHRGHQAVIGGAAEDAARLDAPLVVVTFEPHPRVYFRPEDPPFRLTPFRSKAIQLAALGVDVLVVLTFDRAMAQMSAEDFVRKVLIGGLAPRQVTVGYDFHFGHQRKGDPAMMRRMMEEGGDCTVRIVEPVASADGEVYSSTKIRNYLQSGQPGQAAALLGRPFEIQGRVQPGDKRGRTIGFPTANLTLGSYIRPAHGVYAVRAGLGDGDAPEWIDGVANFGVRPTVDGKKLLLETHLFDFDRDIYGQQMRVGLIEYIRPEKRFDGLEALTAQIAEDSAAARRILRTRAAGAA